MTDKEQIIIDGCNVSGCEHVCNTAFGNIGCKLPFNKELHCCNNPNCYFKQLARKEQECEKYKQTLDEFELLITNHISSCEKCPDNKNGYCIGIDECSSRCLNKILDIINKAKEK